MLYEIGQKLVLEKCSTCKINTAVFTVQKPIDEQWFVNCDKCGEKKLLEQQLK